MSRSGLFSIPFEARKDIAWWNRFITEYNGISIIWLIMEPATDAVLATDACLTGLGGTLTSHREYFKGRFPEHMTTWNIAQLELIAVLTALKLWAHKLQGKYFWIHVDNEAVSSILNTGASRDATLQDILREIALVAAQHQFVLKARHIRGVDNRLPDWLSRWGDSNARRQFHTAIQDGGWKQQSFSQHLLKLTHEW